LDLHHGGEVPLGKFCAIISRARSCRIWNSRRIMESG
jgi:hypothetical protein